MKEQLAVEEKEDNSMWDKFTRSLPSIKREVVHYGVRVRIDRLRKIPRWGLRIHNSQYDKLERRADRKDHNCVVQEGRKLFCWTFKYQGKWRAHDIRNGCVGIYTPFAPGD